MGNSLVSSNPYEVGEVICDFSSWCVHGGKRKVDGELVSVLRYRHDGVGNLAVSKLKGYRHPYVLRFMEELSVGNEVYIVTERATPLELRRGQLSSYEAKYGFVCICEAIRFLHDDCKVAHHAISGRTIFVDEEGDWKVGDLTNSSNIVGPSSDLFDLMKCIVDMGDCSDAGMKVVTRWFEKIRAKGKDVKVATILGSNTFRNDSFLSLMKQINEIDTVDEIEQRTKVFETILARWHEVSKWPRSYKTKKIFARLVRTIKIVLSRSGSATSHPATTGPGTAGMARNVSHVTTASTGGLPTSATTSYAAIEASKTATIERSSSWNGGNSAPQAAPTTPAEAMKAVATVYLNLLFKLLPSCKDETETKGNEIVTQLFVMLFGCNDRMIRSILLQNIESIIALLDADVLNKKIFDQICNGFLDSNGAMRECTLKSMVHLAPHLNLRNLVDKCIKFVCKLQASDTEPSIRTNATVLIGKLASFMNEKTRGKVLPLCLLKAFRDPFPFARLAGARAASSFLSSEYFETGLFVHKILPAMVPLAVDPSSEVRETAIKCLREVTTRIETFHEEAKRKEEEKRALEAKKETKNSIAGMKPTFGTVPKTLIGPPGSTQTSKSITTTSVFDTNSSVSPKIDNLSTFLNNESNAADEDLFDDLSNGPTGWDDEDDDLFFEEEEEEEEEHGHGHGHGDGHGHEHLRASHAIPSHGGLQLEPKRIETSTFAQIGTYQKISNAPSSIHSSNGIGDRNSTNSRITTVQTTTVSQSTSYGATSQQIRTGNGLGNLLNNDLSVDDFWNANTTTQKSNTKSNGVPMDFLNNELNANPLGKTNTATNGSVGVSGSIGSIGGNRGAGITTGMTSASNTGSSGSLKGMKLKAKKLTVKKEDDMIDWDDF